MWVRGHSKSLKLVPFESVGAVSYSPFIVTGRKPLVEKNEVTLNSGLGVVQGH